MFCENYQRVKKDIHFNNFIHVQLTLLIRNFFTYNFFIVF